MKHKHVLLTATLTLGLALNLLAQVPSYVPSNGLVGWWPFNGNANDESGNGNNGTPLNGISITSDRFGIPNNAYYFDGVDDYINLPGGNLTTLNIVGNYSLSLWMKTAQIPFGSQVTFADNTTNSGGFLFNHLTPTNPNKLSFYTGNAWNFTECGINDNTWINFIIVASGNTLTVFKNGNVCYTNSSIVSCSSYSGPRMFGVSSLGNFGFYEGLLDDIGIWNRALNQQEINALYQGCQVSVATDPTNQTATVGGNAQFTVSVSEVGATYQWQTDLGLGWQNVSNAGQYNGATSDTLRISNVTVANNNQAFRCIISSGSCTDTSETAVLTVIDNSAIGEFTDIEVQISPNPHEGVFQLLVPEHLLNRRYTIRNATGTVIKKGRIEQLENTIRIEDVAAGIYYLEIEHSGTKTYPIIKR